MEETDEELVKCFFFSIYLKVALDKLFFIKYIIIKFN